MAGLRKQVKGLNIGGKRKSQAADVDPEDDLFSRQPASDDESESDVSQDETIGREHYESVGKSKLRKPEKSKIDDKKYGGQAVSRSKIFQDDENDALAPVDDEDEDPFAITTNGRGESSGSDKSEEDDLSDGENLDGEFGSDDEIDSDEAFEEGEEDKMRGKGFVFRGSGKGLKALPTSGSDSEGSDQDKSILGSEASDDHQSDLEMEDLSAESDEDSENVSQDDEDDEENGEDEQTARPRPSSFPTSGSTDREKLKALISNDAAALASSLSASLSADAKKGAAVKKQNQTFDRLLDARIKLQKSLTASNDLHLRPSATTTTTDSEDAKSALRKAEEAALKLYSTIESLRHSILEASTPNADQASKKRKRPEAASSQTSNSDLWSRLKALETQSLPLRRQTLDKWSSKTRASAPLPTQQSKLSANTSQPESKLSSVLDAYLLNETPKILLLNQTQAPTPDNTITTTTGSAIPYDDATFYQSLLRDLINSRATTTNLQSGGAMNMPIVPMKLHASGNAAKARKVDTKASKGRKIRYTVHEKLEHFMAGEGRGNSVGQWNEGAVSEFFASLLGQRGMLGEGEEDDQDQDGEIGGEGREVEALRLFRT